MTTPSYNPVSYTERWALLADIFQEIGRQDMVHPKGYPAERDGVFLGITTAIHELEREAIDAWRGERCRCQTPNCGHADWQYTRDELVQAAAIILRTIRSIDDAKRAKAAGRNP
jgi:hypothetical protein